LSQGSVNELLLKKTINGKVEVVGSKPILIWDNPAQIGELIAYLKVAYPYPAFKLHFSWQGKDGHWHTAPVGAIFPEGTEDWRTRFAEIEAESLNSESWWAYRLGVVSGPDHEHPMYTIAVEPRD
jgi:hypothetical protein